MTLPFMTHWRKDMPEHMAGRPTYFVEMVWASIDDRLLDEFFWEHHHISFHNREEIWRLFEAVDHYINWDAYDCLMRDDESKIHTIRFMTPERAAQWAKKDRDTHFVINNRTPQRFQFAPLVKCTGVQEMDFLFDSGHVEIFIDNDWLGEVYHHGLDDIYDVTNDLDDMTKNDGFDTIEDFFAYFTQERMEKAKAKGKSPYIIHWTDKMY